MMDYDKQVVRRVMEAAHPHPGVALQFLLMRLEHVPEARLAIVEALRDVDEWFRDFGDDLDNSTRIREFEILNK